MPAILLGYELERARGIEVERIEAESVPPWLIHVQQQAGGTCMVYPQATGLLLRLEGNASFAHNDLSKLLSGFRLMSENSDIGWLEAIAIMREEYPQLAPVHATRGKELDAAQLHSLKLALEPYFSLPAPVSGWEAFVRLAECELIDVFGAWSVVQFDAGLDQIPETMPDEALPWRDSAPLEQAILDELSRLVGGGRPPRAFLLWENCD